MALRCPHCGKSIPDSVVTAYSGSIGRKKTAKRRPEYFRQLQARRKTHAGGRPTSNKPDTDGLVKELRGKLYPVKTETASE